AFGFIFRRAADHIDTGHRADFRTRGAAGAALLDDKNSVAHISFNSWSRATSFFAFSSGVAPSIFSPPFRGGGLKLRATIVGEPLNPIFERSHFKSSAFHLVTTAFLAASLPLSEAKRGSLISLTTAITHGVDISNKS